MASRNPTRTLGLQEACQQSSSMLAGEMSLVSTTMSYSRSGLECSRMDCSVTDIYGTNFSLQARSTTTSFMGRPSSTAFLASRADGYLDASMRPIVHVGRALREGGACLHQQTSATASCVGGRACAGASICKRCRAVLAGATTGVAGLLRGPGRRLSRCWRPGRPRWPARLRQQPRPRWRLGRRGSRCRACTSCCPCSAASPSSSWRCR